MLISMIGLVSTFLITFILAIILTLGMFITLKTKITGLFKKTPPPPAQSAEETAEQLKKSDPVRALVGLFAQTFFTIAIWAICFNTAQEIIALLKAGK